MGENGACASSKSAQDLLTEFQQTGQEAPFAEIARRYAGMVYNVALRVTHDAHDAEDATQATFLTLAVHAKTSGKIRFLGPWLKKVSHRLALDIRRSKKRRTAREQRHAASNGAESNGNGNGHDLPIASGLHTEELRHILRDEIDRLPAKYRMPLILYYFGGLTPEEIGGQLHCNTSTLGVRLHRGRKMLAESLSARGITMSAAIVAAVLSGLVDSFVKDNVVHAATSAAMRASVNGFTTAHASSGHVLHLMRLATSALKWARLKAVVAVAVLMVSTLALGREAYKRLDLGNSTLLQHLNPMRLIQPLLDRFLGRPQFSVQVNPSTPQLRGLDELSSGLQMPLYYANSSDPDLSAAPSAAPRGGGISLSSTTPAVQQSAVPNIQLHTIAPPQTLYTVSPNRASTSTLQPSAVASRVQPVAAPLTITPSVGSVGSISLSAAPAFVMPSPNQPLIIDGKSGDVLFGGMSVSNFTLPANQTTRATTVVIGDTTAGTLLQNSGTLHVSTQLVVAKQPGSKGNFQINNSARVDAPQIVVAAAGAGTITQDGGMVNATTPDHTGQVVIGQQPSSSGTYNLSGGTLTADTVVVGQQGIGQVNQTGGTPVVTIIQIGAQQGASGTWSSSGLTPILTSYPENPATAVALTDFSQSPAAPIVPTIIVGGSGSGSFVIQPTPGDSTAPIQETPDAHGTSLIVRSDLTGAGTFSGSGVIQLTGTLTQNGQIIADGNGTHQALDLSSASKISNTIENTPNGGTNGWYARNLGSLVLPRIPISGSKNYTWGEDTLDDTIDLVNSVRFVPHSLDPNGPNGDAGITLYDPNDPAIPALPDGRHAIGLWGFDTTADMSSVDLTVRFDDQMAHALNIPLADLGLWAYQDKWVQIDDASFAIDLSQDLISGTVTGPFSYFAVGGLPPDVQQAILAAPQQPTVLGPTLSRGSGVVPEPGTALLAAGALGTLLTLRRSRRRRD